MVDEAFVDIGRQGLMEQELAAGAYVIVINAEKVAIGGRKAQQKMYYRHSGQPGGLKTETFEHLQKVGSSTT